MAALLFYLHNQAESEQAGQDAEALLADVQAAIAERTAAFGAPGSINRPEDPDAPPAGPEPLPEVMLQGYPCIGYVSAPVIGLELPVFAEWDYMRLRVAPCRQFGSPLTDDFVIAGHNYARHFGQLERLQLGDEVLFTDMDGNVYTYVVAALDKVNPTDVAAVQNSRYDLVLYTCTKDVRLRVTVFCDRVEP